MDTTEPADLSPDRTLGRGARLKAAVAEAHVVLGLLLTPALEDLGLTSGEADVLTILHLNPDPLLPGQIAAQLNITGPGATGRLNSLERRRHIQRVRNPDDGRSVRVHLTERGSELAVAVIDQKNTMIDDAVVAEIGDGDADELIERLERLVAVAVTRL